MEVDRAVDGTVFPEARGVSCYTLAVVDLSSIRKGWRVTNAVELVIPPRAMRRVPKQVR